MKKITRAVILIMMAALFVILAPDTMAHIIGLYILFSGKMVLDALDEI